MATVLIAEDDTDIRNAYTFALTRAGYRVAAAADGAQALELLASERPDVVILDMLMPGMSGMDFLRQGQLSKQLPDTKVLAFSNIDNPKVVEEARELGVAEYVIKVDMTPRQMVEIVEKYAHA